MEALTTGGGAPKADAAAVAAAKAAMLADPDNVELVEAYLAALRGPRYVHRLVIGDASGDGHGRAATFSFACSHDKAAVWAAYDKAAELSGVTLLGGRGQSGVQVAAESEDSLLSAEHGARIEALIGGGRLSEVLEPEDDGGPYRCYPDQLAQLFFELVASQLPGFRFELVNDPQPINDEVGGRMASIGYGCFT